MLWIPSLSAGERNPLPLRSQSKAILPRETSVIIHVDLSNYKNFPSHEAFQVNLFSVTLNFSPCSSNAAGEKCCAKCFANLVGQKPDWVSYSCSFTVLLFSIISQWVWVQQPAPSPSSHPPTIFFIILLLLILNFIYTSFLFFSSFCVGEVWALRVWEVSWVWQHEDIGCTKKYKICSARLSSGCKL